MSSIRSKPWVLVLGAALAIGGGIYLLKILKKKSYLKPILREIDRLTAPKKDADGKVSFSYLKLVYFITIEAFEEWFEQKNECNLTKRRDLLLKNNLTEYKTVVIQMNEEKTLLFNEALKNAMNYAGEGFYNKFLEFFND